MLRKIREICQRYNFRPLRRRGQNFLINKGILEKIVKTADLKKDDLVLEVGAGLGFLTEELAKRVKRVLAIEIDKELIKILEERLKNYKNVKIVKEDILSKEAEEIISEWANPIRSSAESNLLKSYRANPVRKSQLMSIFNNKSHQELSSRLSNGANSPNGLVLPKKQGLLKTSNGARYKIVANLPYNITSRFLRNFLSSKNNPIRSSAESYLLKSHQANPPYGLELSKSQNLLKTSNGARPESMVLMVQKEVGKRIVAKPPLMSKLSVMVQFYSQPKIIFLVKKANFWPRPKVESVILKISEIKRRLNVNEENFFEMVRAGFLSPRKYLLNNLEKGEIIKKEEEKKIFKKIGLSLKIRAQELSVEDWEKLYASLLGIKEHN